MSSNKTALVTGAAARIGAAIARKLHDRGCNVIIHYNASDDEAERLAGALNERREGSAAVASADLSNLKAVDALAERVREILNTWGGGLDVLVNNASRFYPTAIGETRLYEWEDLVNSNLRGPYFLIQALLTPLLESGGNIVNLLDIHSDRPMPEHPVYCASKAGLRMMTLSLAAELGPDVRVNGVSPGAILWPDREVSENAKAAILSRTALKRLGDPDDIASAVAFLALDAPYVTGEIIRVDG
ncbi:MAG: pteridine reductase, partial [Xanthomonadales bacterium]|nr:pteridine reductase [Xanthomonadales bacterium]